MQNNLQHQGCEQYNWVFSVTKISIFLKKVCFSFGQREAIEGQKHVDSKKEIQFVSINIS